MADQILDLDKYVHPSTSEYSYEYNMESVRYVALVRPDGFMQIFQIDSETHVELSDFYDEVDYQQNIDYDFDDHIIILVKDHEVVGMVLRYMRSYIPTLHYPTGYLISDPLPQDWLDELNKAQVRALIGDDL